MLGSRIAGARVSEFGNLPQLYLLGERTTLRVDTGDGNVPWRAPGAVIAGIARVCLVTTLAVLGTKILLESLRVQ